MYATDKIYSDTDIEAIESLPLKAWHRAVDVEIVKADTEGSYFSFFLSYHDYKYHILPH